MPVAVSLRSRFFALGLLAAAVPLAGCVGIDPSSPAAQYSIRVIPRGAAITNDAPRVNFNTRPGEIRSVLQANPGLGEALRANGVRIADVRALRVQPTGVVRVYTR